MDAARLSCEEVEADVIGLLDGELDALRADVVHAHFRDCAGCARFYQSLRSQLVLHRWAHEAPFELDDGGRPGDVPDFDALSTRLRAADLGALGGLLYEILKAEFLYDYGDDVDAREAAIDDPVSERRRASDMVGEMRDWYDADEVEGVDLGDLARRLEMPSIDRDRLAELVAGMEAVARAAPALAPKAAFYQGLAWIKAGDESRAAERFGRVAAEAAPDLARIARICLATLPAIVGGRPAEAIPALEACLAGDGADAIVHFNLCQAHFEAAGQRLTPAVQTHAERARAMNAALVDHQLSLPRQRALRLALQSSRVRTESTS
jgi:hypothetical protein